ASGAPLRVAVPSIATMVGPLGAHPPGPSSTHADRPSTQSRFINRPIVRIRFFTTRYLLNVSADRFAGAARSRRPIDRVIDVIAEETDMAIDHDDHHARRMAA